MHQLVPANRDIDMRRQTSTGHSQSNLGFNMVDSVAFRAGGGINLTVTPEMSSVELVRSLMSAANAYFGFQPRGLDYRYTSLEPEEDAIRLLALFPDQQAEEVKCKIVHTTLSEKPHYEALSYTVVPYPIFISRRRYVWRAGATVFYEAGAGDIRSRLSVCAGCDTRRGCAVQCDARRGWVVYTTMSI